MNTYIISNSYIDCIYIYIYIYTVYLKMCIWFTHDLKEKTNRDVVVDASVANTHKHMRVLVMHTSRSRIYHHYITYIVIRNKTMISFAPRKSLYCIAIIGYLRRVHIYGYTSRNNNMAWYKGVFLVNHRCNKHRCMINSYSLHVKIQLLQTRCVL